MAIHARGVTRIVKQRFVKKFNCLQTLEASTTQIFWNIMRVDAGDGLT